MDYIYLKLGRAKCDELLKSAHVLPEHGYDLYEFKRMVRYRPFLRVRTIFITILHLLSS